MDAIAPPTPPLAPPTPATSPDIVRPPPKPKRKAHTTEAAPTAQSKRIKATIARLQTILQSTGHNPTLLAALNTSLAQPPPAPTILCPVKKLALPEILTNFGFTYSDTFARSEHTWDIHLAALSDDDLFLIDAARHAFTRLIFFYADVGVRDHEAICRILADKVFLEAIAVVNGRAQILLDEQAKWDLEDPTPYSPDRAGAEFTRHWAALSTRWKRRTPTEGARIKLYGEMDLHHTCPITPSSSSDPSALIQFTGRCDYSIGLTLPSPPPSLPHPHPPHASILLVCEAKKDSDIPSAVTQLFGYLGILHSARRAAGRRADCTTFGVATDGYKWVFVRVGHKGGVRRSGEMDVRVDGGGGVVRGLVGVLRESLGLVTPGNSPVRPPVGAGAGGGGDSGEELPGGGLADDNLVPVAREEEAVDDDDNSDEDDDEDDSEDEQDEEEGEWNGSEHTEQTEVEETGNSSSKQDA